MGVAAERELAKLETLLAEVMNLSELGRDVLPALESVLRASGAWLFAFGPRSQPLILGGSMAHAMGQYTHDIFESDPLQAYARALPREAFLSNERNDFDVRAYVRSAAYAEFYRPQSIGFVQGVYPTGLPYGAPHMFGIAVSMPDLDVYMRDMMPVLRCLEAPLRSAARRIMRFQSLETERDVLRLVATDPGVCALWDDAANLVWLSPSAASHLDDQARSALERAIDLAARQSMGGEPSLGMGVLGRPFEVRTRAGLRWDAELSRVRTPEDRYYLLAQLRPSSCPSGAVVALTKAERRVLELLARGQSNQEIGRALYVSNDTIKSHVSNILGKLGVPSRAKAAVAARALGLVAEHGA